MNTAPEAPPQIIQILFANTVPEAPLQFSALSTQTVQMSLVGSLVVPPLRVRHVLSLSCIASIRTKLRQPRRQQGDPLPNIQALDARNLKYTAMHQ